MHNRQFFLILATMVLVSCSGDPAPGASGTDGGTAGQAGHDAGPGGCVAWTCAKLGAGCGQAPDGCGGVLECGTCPAGQFCGGKGPNVCGTDPCVNKTCAEGNASCGYASNGCGSVIDCGTCKDGEVCEIRVDSQFCRFEGCNNTDFCQSRKLKSGWHCDISTRVRCAEQGECGVVAERVDCGAQGCSNGACGTACVTPCQGHCGSYQGCSCGDCPTDSDCIDNVCKVDCQKACYGYCGTLNGCACGSCTSPDTCVSNKCVCKEGATGSQACTIADNCPAGKETGTCTGGAWEWSGECLAGSSVPRYAVLDGEKHCGSGIGEAQLCIKLAVGSTTGTVTISRVDGKTFSSDMDIELRDQDDSFLGPYVECQPAKGHTSLQMSFNLSDLFLFVGDTIWIQAVTTSCTDGETLRSEGVSLSQCRE